MRRARSRAASRGRRRRAGWGAEARGVQGRFQRQGAGQREMVETVAEAERERAQQREGRVVFDSEGCMGEPGPKEGARRWDEMGDGWRRGGDGERRNGDEKSQGVESQRKMERGGNPGCLGSDLPRHPSDPHHSQVQIGPDSQRKILSTDDRI